MNKKFTPVLRACMAMLFITGISSTQFARADENGAAVFLKNCATCHGTTAEGIDGLAPPLRNAELWSKLGSSAPDYISGVVTSGMSGKISVEGQSYRGMVMPPQTHLSSAELAAVASYVLKELNGHAAKVDAELIEAKRQAPVAHTRLLALRQGEAGNEQVAVVVQTGN
jgi:mono/diheme cytochrome c family protein